MTDQQPSKSKVTLEDLLRLKRAERPPQEFWAQFETSLRQRQLQAAVEPKQWWKVSFWRAPAFRWISLSSGALGAVAAVAIIAGRPAAPSLAAPDVGNQLAATSTVVASVAQPSQQAQTPHVSKESHSKAASNLPDPATVLADFVPATVKAPVADSLAISKRSGFDQVVVTSVQPDESAATEAVGDNSAVDSRRSRLLAYAESSLGPVSENPNRNAHSRERVISRLSDQALYDTMSRVDVGGNHLSIKF